MSNYDEDLVSLDEWLRRLKVEYDIFFNGHRKKPPDDLRLRLEKLVKKLSESSGMSFAQRFRYNTLVGRYYVYRDLWRRTLAELESGAGAKEQAQADSAGQTGSSQQSGETMISIANPESDQNEVRRLYEALTKLRGDRAGAPPLMPYSQFAQYIAAQTQRLKQKSGCSSVLFTLAVEGDSVKFTAKPENKT